MLTAVELLGQQARHWRIELDSTSLHSLSLYADILANYKLANVIGTRERDKIVLDHLIDALSCYVLDDVRCRRSLIDVGSGAGLPGIPLSIIRPELKVTLLEATQKKVRFLQHAREILRLPNLEVLHGRAEEVARTKHREAYDLATARALAALPVVLEYCGPLVGVGGVIIAMKGHLSEKELFQGATAARELRLKLREVRKVEFCSQLPAKERSLAVYDKPAATPRSFPRQPGIAKKRPLGA